MWYVIQTENGSEEETCRSCEKAFPAGSFRAVFVPQYERMFHLKGDWIVVRRPLFPGYLFVDTEDPEAVEAVCREALARIARPVRVGRDFSPIDPEEQALLECLLDARTHTIPLSSGDFAEGAFALRSGPLYEMPSIIRRIDLHKRLAECRVFLLGEERQMRVGIAFPQAG